MKHRGRVCFSIAIILGSTGAVAQAGKVYATHTGGSGDILDGTAPSNAVTLITALAIANAEPSRRHILLLAGTYDNVPQVEIAADDVMLDGGRAGRYLLYSNV